MDLSAFKEKKFVLFDSPEILKITNEQLILAYDPTYGYDSLKIGPPLYWEYQRLMDFYIDSQNALGYTAHECDSSEVWEMRRENGDWVVFSSLEPDNKIVLINKLEIKAIQKITKELEKDGVRNLYKYHP